MDIFAVQIVFYQNNKSSISEIRKNRRKRKEESCTPKWSHNLLFVCAIIQVYGEKRIRRQVDYMTKKIRTFLSQKIKIPVIFYVLETLSMDEIEKWNYNMNTIFDTLSIFHLIWWEAGKKLRKKSTIISKKKLLGLGRND